MLVHAFSLAGVAALQLQLFTGSSLDESVFKFTVRQLYKSRLNPRHTLNSSSNTPQTALHVSVATKFCTPQKNQNKNLLLHKPISCHYIERSTDVSTRKIKGTSAVNCVIAATTYINPVHFPHLVSDNFVQE